VNIIISLFLLLLSIILIYRGYIIESLFILIGTSYIIYPIYGSIIILDIIFCIILFFNLEKISFSKNELLLILIVSFSVFVPSLLYYELDSVLQPLRFIQLLILFFATYKSQRYINDTSLFIVFFSVIFLNFIFNIFQVFHLFFEVKAIPSPTIGGFFKDSAQLGPFVLLVFVSLTYFFKDDKKRLLILSILSILTVILSSNRTSLVILIFILFINILNRRNFIYILFIIPICFIGFNYLEQISPKNYELINDIIKGSYQLIYKNTLVLRYINWSNIINYYYDNCSILLGCGYGQIENMSYLLKSSFGVFSFDNAYLRLLVEGGLIFGSIKLVIIFSLIYKHAPKLIIPFLLLSITQETIEDILLISIIFLILSFKAKQNVQNTSA